MLALALFAGVAYEEVRRCLVEALRGAVWWPHPREPWRTWRVPAKSALVQARARLGAAPLRLLFAQAARPLATPETQGAWYRGLPVVALDGTCLDVADTPANAAAFGRPGTGRGQGVGPSPGPAGHPGRVRHPCHHQRGDRAVPHRRNHPGSRVLKGLGPGMLALADRGLLTVKLWRQARASGAELVWRAKTGRPGMPYRSMSCWRMGPGGHGWTLAATAVTTRVARLWSGCWTTPSMIPGRASSSATGW